MMITWRGSLVKPNLDGKRLGQEQAFARMLFKILEAYQSAIRTRHASPLVS